MKNELSSNNIVIAHSSEFKNDVINMVSKQKFVRAKLQHNLQMPEFHDWEQTTLKNSRRTMKITKMTKQERREDNLLKFNRACLILTVINELESSK